MDTGRESRAALRKRETRTVWVDESKREKAVADEQRLIAQLEAARREAQSTAEEERKAREALRDSTSQARLGKFIRERASSADYEKHLGLIAMIHRDFDRLSGMMEKQQKETGDPGVDAIQRYAKGFGHLSRSRMAAPITPSFRGSTASFFTLMISIAVIRRTRS